MLQPLTHDLRYPFVEELVESYGPYLERLAKDDKYGLICSLSRWLQFQAETAVILGEIMPVTENNLNNLFEEFRISTTVDKILRKYLVQLNEPMIQNLIISLIQQLREGYYRQREMNEHELEDIGIEMEPYCDTLESLSLTDEDVVSPEFDKD